MSCLHALQPLATRSLMLLSIIVSCVIARNPAMGASVTNATIGTQPREVVYNAAAIKPFVDAAQARRVDIAGIGDSNQVGGPGGNYGWDHGYSKAWSDRFGEYATGLFGTNADGGWNGPQGYIDSWAYPYGASSTGAPAALDKYKLYADALNDGVNDFPPTYAYFGPTYVEPTNHWVPMMTVRKPSPLWGQNLRWQLTYGTFDTGAGGFTPSVAGQTAHLYTGPRVSTSTGSIGLVDGAFSISASTYNNAAGDEIYFGLSFMGEGTMRGPFFGLWQRVEGDRASGVSYSTMLWQGGRALVHAATALQAQPEDAMREYIRNLVKLQTGPKMLLVQVNHGQNDGGITIPSVGPNPARSDTPAGFADDMDAVILRLRSTWVAMGYDPKNLMFQYGPYHPAEGSAEDGTGRTRIQRLADWENAIIGLSQRHPEYNLAVVRGTRMTTPRTMDKNGWYTSDADHAHLSIAGYIGVAELGVRELLNYADAAEIKNRSGVTSLSFTFSDDVSADLSPDDLSLKSVGDGATMDPFNLAVDWDQASKTATWTFQGLPLGELPAGDYEATVRMSQLGLAAPDYLFNFTAPVVVPEPAATGAAAAAGAGVIIGMSRRRATR